MEKEFLGLLLDNYKCFLKAKDFGNFFYDKDCRHIYDLMLELYNRNIKITPDAIHILDSEIYQDELDEYRMLATEVELFEDQFDKLKKNYLHGEIKYILGRYEEIPYKEMVSKIENVLLNRGKSENGFKNIKEIHAELYNLKPLQRKLCGISLLDKYGGVRKNSLIIIGARPKCGKTSMMAQLIAFHIKQNNKITIFSQEINSLDLDAKIISNLTEIPSNKILDGKCSDDEKMAVAKILDETKNNIALISEKRIYLHDIIRQIKYMKKKYDIDCVFIDHLHFIMINSKENRIQQLGNIVNKLVELKNELNIIIYLLAQLNRDSEINPRPPRMSDLKGSGSIEQAADVICLMHAKDEIKNYRQYVDLKIINRFGVGGIMNMIFEKHISKFNIIIND